ncbi:hypothetical protein FI667_g3789, partial [Globisporangium splendens]
MVVPAVHSVNYFSDIPPHERLRYLKAVKGMEIDKGEALFHIGDAADAFYCVTYGSLDVVMDFAHMAAPTLNEFEEILSRARVHSSLLNPGGAQDLSQDATYVVRTLKTLECFGDVGLLLSDPHRTATVVANERTRMEKVTFSYNDVIVREGELTNYFYFVRHGECHFVKHFNLSVPSRRPLPQDIKTSTSISTNKTPATFVEICTIGSRHYVGAYETVLGAANAVLSVLVSSPTAILYRVERLEFRHVALKDTATESLLKQEALALSGRIDASSIAQELRVDAAWRQASTCSPRSYHNPQFHTEQQQVDESAIANETRRTEAECPAPQSAKTEHPRTESHESAARTKKRQEMARDDQAIASNIQWSKTTKILGDLSSDDDSKVMSAIVSLFTRSDGI